MSEEVELVYLSLNQLLNDICKFLKEGVNNDALTPKARREADILIRRSTVQLKKITSLTNQLESKEVSPERTEVKSSNSKKEIRISSKNSTPNPYQDTPAKSIPQPEKYGYIEWRTKFIFGLDRMKKIYAVVYRDWLLIYGHEKDSKPSYSFSLQTNKANMNADTQMENQSQNFCLVNIESQITIQFRAQTHKDMLQWVTKINKCHNNLQHAMPRVITAPIISETQENEIIAEDSSPIYDQIYMSEQTRMTTNEQTVSKQEEEKEEDEGDTYEEIVARPLPPPIRPFGKSTSTPPERPSHLPIRNQPSLPSIPTEENGSMESLPSYDKIGTSDGGRDNLSDSFSEEEEEEEMYAEVIAPPQPPLALPDLATPSTPSAASSPLTPLAPSTSSTPPISLTPSIKPPVMTKPTLKPKIEVKLSKPFPNGYSSTKNILKSVKETSKQ